MTTHTVNLADFIKNVQALPGDVEQAIIRGMRSAAMRGVSVVVEQIGTKNSGNGAPPAVDEGTLQRSVSSSPIPKGGEIIVDAPHAAIVEYGTRPHMPPKQPLVDWAKRKFGVDEDEAEDIAQAVRWKIFHHGTKPRFYMRRAVTILRKRIVLQEIERELKKLP
jgi:hypothetical protein